MPLRHVLPKLPPEYYEVYRQSRGYGEERDCAVRAVTHATGRPYAEVLAAFDWAGRPAFAATPMHVTRAVLRYFGFDVFKYPIRASRASVRALVEGLPTSGTYLVEINGHIFCHRDGRSFDAGGYGLRGVRGVYRVV